MSQFRLVMTQRLELTGPAKARQHEVGGRSLENCEAEEGEGGEDRGWRVREGVGGGVGVEVEKGGYAAADGVEELPDGVSEGGVLLTGIRLISQLHCSRGGTEEGYGGG